MTSVMYLQELKTKNTQVDKTWSSAQNMFHKYQQTNKQPEMTEQNTQILT